MSLPVLTIRYTILMAGLLAISVPVGAQPCTTKVAALHSNGPAGKAAEEALNEALNDTALDNASRAADAQEQIGEPANRDPYFTPTAAKSTSYMPRVIIRNIREDRAGNIWFATFGGPIRYDGKDFTNFSEEVGLAATRVFSLREDRSGALWFGSIKTFTKFSATAPSSLSAKTAQNANSTLKDQMSAIAKGETVSEMSKSIWSVFQDKNNNYWFGSDGQGVYRYDGKTITNFTTKDGLCDNQIRGIQDDKSGNVYINTVKGISRFDGTTFATLSVTENKPSTNGWRLHPDDLWFGGAQDTGVVYRYDGKSLHRLEFPKTKRGDEELLKYPRSKFPNAKYSPYDVYTIYRDRRGSVWFGTATLGVCRYDGKSFDWLYEDHLTNTPEGGSFGIRSIIEDKEGKFWFCNTQYRYNISPNNLTENGKGLIHYKQEKGIGDLKAIIGEDFFYFPSIVEDNKRDLWMAGGGAWRYDGESMTHYPVKDGSKDVRMVSIYKDNRGDPWLGTNEAGAYKFNGKTFEKFKP